MVLNTPHNEFGQHNQDSVVISVWEIMKVYEEDCASQDLLAKIDLEILSSFKMDLIFHSDMFFSKL